MHYALHTTKTAETNGSPLEGGGQITSRNVKGRPLRVFVSRWLNMPTISVRKFIGMDLITGSGRKGSIFSILLGDFFFFFFFLDISIQYSCHIHDKDVFP